MNIKQKKIICSTFEAKSCERLNSSQDPTHVVMKSMGLGKKRDINKITIHQKINEHSDTENESNYFEQNQQNKNINEVTCEENIESANTSEKKNLEKSNIKNIIYNIIIPIIIILNTVNLILRAQSIRYIIICNIFDIIFTLFSIIEIIIKIKFEGLIIDPDSFLRYPLNVFDSIITILSLINILLNIIKNIKENRFIIEMTTNYCNISEFRLVDLIFPLYQIKYFSSMKIFLNGCIISVKSLLPALIYFLFFYVLFSVLGLQLWQNRFEYLCHEKTEPENGFFPVTDLFKNTLCGGANKCNSKMEFCLSTKEFYKNNKLTYEINNKKLYDIELDNIDFNYGITKYSNILYSLLSTIIFSTGQGWVKIMSHIMDGYSYWVGYIYFFIFQIVFNVILKNFILSIIIISFEKSKQDTVIDISTNNQAKLTEKADDAKYKAKYHLIKKSRNYKKKIIQILGYTGKKKKCSLFIFYPKLTIYHKKYAFSYWIYLVYHQYLTQIIFYIFILLNIAVVIFELSRKNKEINYYNLNGYHSSEYNFTHKIKYIIIFVYSVEQILCFLGFGPVIFFTNFGYLIDFIIYLITISNFFLGWIPNRNNDINNPSIVFGILRLFKILFNLSILPIMKQIIIRTAIFGNALIKSLSIIPLTIIYLFIYSLFGYSLFHSSLTYNNGYVYNKSFSSNIINFDNFFNSLFATFVITLKDHWEEIFYFCYRSETNIKIFTIFYYFNIVFIGQYLLLNLYIGFLLEQCLEQRDKYDLNTETRTYLENKHLETTKLYQLEKLQGKGKERILKINLFKQNKKLFAENGNLVLVGTSEINYDKYSFIMRNNFYFLHSNKKNDNKKEILAGDVFKEYTIKSQKDKKELEKIKYYHFNVNYLKVNNNEMNNIKKFNSDTILQIVKDGNREITRINLNHNTYIPSDSKKDHLKNNIISLFGRQKESNENFKKNGEEIESEDEENEVTDLIINEEKNIRKKNDEEIITQEESNRKINSISKEPTSKEQSDEDFSSSKLLRLKYKNLIPTKRKSGLNISTKMLANYENRRKSIEIRINPIKERLMKQIILMSKKQLNKQSTKMMSMLSQEKIINNNNYNYKEIFEYMWNSSLFIFHQNSKIRSFARYLVNLHEFILIVKFLIIINTVVLCFDSKWIEKKSSAKNILNLFNMILTIFFVLECLLRIISDDLIFQTPIKTSLGDKNSKIAQILVFDDQNENNEDFENMDENERMETYRNSLNKLKHRKTYLSDPYNVIDFICVIVSVIDLFHQKETGILFIVMTALKCLKPIRLINKSKNLKMLVSVIFNSFYSILSSLFIIILLILILSIFGLFLFNTKTTKICSLGLDFLTEEECLKNNGYWVGNVNGFKNILYAFKLTFVLLTAENWANVMSDIYILTQNDSISFFYFSICVITLNLVIIKIIPSILIYSSREVQKNDSSYENLTDAEIQWVKFQIEMSQSKPTTSLFNFSKANSTYKKIYDILNNRWYIIISQILSILNIFLAFFKINDNSILSFLLDTLFSIIVIIFTLEIILKIVVYGDAFKNHWNIFDFIIIILNDILFILTILHYHTNIVNTEKLNTISIVISSFSLFRVLKIIPEFEFLQKYSLIFIDIIKKLSGISFLILIVTIIYANIGTNIFGLLPYRKYINRVNNFRNFLSSSLILLEVLTGGDWNMMMNEMLYHDCRVNNSDIYLNDYYCVNFSIICYDNGYINHTFVNYANEHPELVFGNVTDFDLRNNTNAYHLSCGSDFSYIFFVSYIMIVQIIFLSFFTMIILDNFEKLTMEQKKKGKLISKFINLWMEYDENCKLLVEPHEFVLIFKELPPPYGVNYDRLISNNPIKLIQKERQFKLFRNYIQSKRENGDLKHIHFDDEYINHEYAHLPFAYQFSNFYISKNKKFFTYDLEMLHILDFLEMTATEDKTGVTSTEKYSYLFENKLSNTLKKDKKYYIHFVDACLAISRFVISKNESVNIFSLRDKLVNAYTMNKWMENFNNNEMMELFNTKEELNETKARQMTFKLSSQILKRTTQIFNIKYKNENGLMHINGAINLEKEGRKKRKKKKNEKKRSIIKVYIRNTIRSSYMLLPTNTEFVKRFDRENYYKDVFKKNESKLSILQKCQVDFV